MREERQTRAPVRVCKYDVQRRLTLRLPLTPFARRRLEEYRTNLAPHYGCWSAISSSVKDLAGSTVFAAANSVRSLVDPDEGQIKGEVWGFGPVAATFMATAGFDDLRSGEVYEGPADPMEVRSDQD